MRPVAALLILLSLGAGCSHRDRANPFDPRNPDTGGRPTGFMAIAGSGTVRLQWNVSSNPDLVGYQLYRRIAGESEFQPLGDLIHPAVTLTRDFGLANGVQHSYRLFYVLSGGITGAPAEDHATPGTLRPWVVDYAAASLLRITPDARYVSERSTGYTSTPGVGVDVSTGVVWIVDQDGGRIVLYNPGSGARLAIPGFADPVAVAVDSRRQVGWICDFASDQVYLYGESGQPVGPVVIGPLADPISAAVDSIHETVWICENTGARVSRYDRDGARLASAQVDRPSRVAVDSFDHSAWVTSFSRRSVFHIAMTGALLDTVAGFTGPIGVAVDGARGRIWIADAVASQIVALDRDGRVAFRVGGLSEVREIAVDPLTGDAWATLPGTGEVVRISPVGAVLGRVRGLDTPYGIAIDPGVR